MSAVPKMEVRSILLRAPSPLETLNDTKKDSIARVKTTGKESSFVVKL